MPPKLALILCILFVLYLLRHDSKSQLHVSSALWVPLIWVLIIGSRFVSQWLNIGLSFTSSGSMTEGSPVDRGIFLALEMAGIFILIRRKIDWAGLIRDNKFLSLFILYCGISILWSDYPFVSFKRWTKMLGNIVMVLVVLTDQNPVEAAKTILRRYGFILVPFSVLLIKYFPDIGRYYNQWTWGTFYGGVTLNKNSLGVLSYISGIFFFWSLLIARPKNARLYKQDVLIQIILLVMIGWLLLISQSATSKICFIVGVSFLLVIKWPSIRRNITQIGIYFIILIAFLLMLEFSIGLSSFVLEQSGRDSTLTDRVPIWTELLSMRTNPLIGTGFESFWLGERLARVWDTWKGINQAHNGYLETYLNLGMIGVLLLFGLIVVAYVNNKNELLANFEWGSLSMTFLLMAVISNISEATFHGLNVLLFTFFVIVVKCPRPAPFPVQARINPVMGKS